MSPWFAIKLLFGLARKFKEEPELPDYVLLIAQRTSEYEEKIRRLWEDFKKNPTEENAHLFIELLKQLSNEDWERLLLEILGIAELSSEQREFLMEQLNTNQGFMLQSLLPDLVKEVKKGRGAFDNFDYRVIFLYAGAFWSFGFLSTIMWDGLELRDLGDLFMFIGPKDESTCKGDRGCEQYVGGIFTVAQILTDRIIPGQLKCLTNCRHMLIPIASPL